MGLFDPGQPTVTRLVKNPKLNTSWNQLYGDYGSLRGAGQQSLSDFIQQYLQSTKDAESNTAEENAALSQFYNGNMASTLGQLRAQRQQAVNNAADVATQQALRGVKGAGLADQGTGSSYLDRLAIGATAPIRVQAALDNANLQRSDLDYINANQIGLAGRRTGATDALAQRALVPYGVQTGMMQNNLGYQGALTGLDNANRFYGIHQDPSGFQNYINDVNQVTGAINSTGNAVGALGSLASKFYGIGAGFGGASGIAGGMGGLGGAIAGSQMTPSGMGSIGSYPGGGYTSMRQLDPGGELALARGGMVPYGYYGWGGRVHGPGSGMSDSVPAHLSTGEYVIPAAAVRVPGVLPLLQKIRMMGLQLTPGMGVHPAPGHLAYGGFYADSFGQLGQENMAQDQMLNQQNQQALQMRFAQSQQDQQAQQFAAQQELAKARMAQEAAYQQGELGARNRALGQNQTYLDWQMKQPTPASTRERDIAFNAAHQTASTTGEVPHGQWSPEEQAVLDATASTTRDQLNDMYTHANNIASILNEKQMVDSSIPELQKVADAAPGIGSKVLHPKDAAQAKIAADNAKAQIEANKARQMELTKAMGAIDPKHMALVTYDPERQMYVPNVRRPRAGLAGGSTIDADAAGEMSAGGGNRLAGGASARGGIAKIVVQNGSRFQINADGSSVYLGPAVPQ